MTAHASDADNVRPFNPQQTTHYAMPEQVQFELADLFRASDAIADMADGQPGDAGAELDARHYAPIFRTLAAYGKRLMADIPAVDRTGRRLRA